MGHSGIISVSPCSLGQWMGQTAVCLVLSMVQWNGTVEWDRNRVVGGWDTV